MTVQIVVAGTGTNIGKTVFAAGLTRAMDAMYWKPIQAGMDGETDSQCVQRLAALPADRIIPEAFRLSTPASPHIAAEIDGITIDISRLTPPRTFAPLVIELAGGLAVPVTRQHLQIDIAARWRAPIILCAATHLGTINHSLLSLQALKQRSMPVLGIAFIGDENADSERTICAFGGVKHLGRLPHLDPLNPDTLQSAFARAFRVTDLLGVGGSGP